MTDGDQNAPRVSVVMALHDARAWVADALASVAAQTLPTEDIEVIVVDDGSSDDGAVVAARASPRALVLRQPNRGPSAARNSGIRRARGAFLLFLDADDRLAPDALAASLALFARRPELGLVHTGWRYVDQTGVELPQRWGCQEGDALPNLILGNAIVIHSALVRRELVNRVGGFDEMLHAVEDWDLWLRVARLGAPWSCVDRPLCDYRMRPGSLHTRVVRLFADRIRVLDKVFADPALPPAVAVRRPIAYQTAYLGSACELYGTGDATTGAQAFRTGTLLRPDSLADTATLRWLCRTLLPQGFQCEAAMACDWRRLCGMLRTMLRDLFTTPGLEREIAERRWPIELAFWQTATRLFRKGTTAAVRRRLAYSM